MEVGPGHGRQHAAARQPLNHHKAGDEGFALVGFPAHEKLKDPRFQIDKEGKEDSKLTSKNVVLLSKFLWYIIAVT